MSQRTKLLFSILIPVIVLLLAAIGYFYYQLNKTMKVFPDKNLALPTIDDNWNDYQNKAFGYDLKIPIEYNFNQIGNPGPDAVESGDAICISLDTGVCKIIISGYTNTNKVDLKTWIAKNITQVNSNALQKATFNGYPAFYLKNMTIESYFVAKDTDVVWFQLVKPDTQIYQILSTFKFSN
jgi:hypothetical protein